MTPRWPPDSWAAIGGMPGRCGGGLTRHSPLTTVAAAGFDSCPNASDVEIFARRAAAWLAPGRKAWPPPQEFTGSPTTITMPNRSGSYFHLHLISDATGETLTTVAR